MTHVVQVVAFRSHGPHPTNSLASQLAELDDTWHDGYTLDFAPFPATERSHAAGILREAIAARSRAWQELVAELTGLPPSLPANKAAAAFECVVDAKARTSLTLRSALAAPHPPTFYAKAQWDQRHNDLSLVSWRLHQAGRWLSGAWCNDSCYLDLRTGDPNTEPAKLLAELDQPDDELADTWLAEVDFGY